MYPEKPKRDDEKPKRSSQQAKAPIRLMLVLLILVPALFFILPRFNSEQFIDMILLTMMITITIYLCYEIIIRVLISAFNMRSKSLQNPDFPHESVNR